MSIKFENNTFNKRIKSMLGVDFRRMFTSVLFYIMIGASFVMPILILVMTTMMDGTVSINPQTGEETIIEGFKNVWQIIGSVNGGEQQLAMDITSMCNINMLFFLVAVFVCIFVSDDFRSGYAKNLFTVRSKKSDYVISKTIVCFVAGAGMLIAFFVGSMIGGKITSLPFTLESATIFNVFMSMLSKIALMSIFVSLYGSLIWNTTFAIFQLFLGFYHNSFWFYSMFAYYIMLGIIRFFLLKHTRKYNANEQTSIELKKYVISGWLLLAMNLALAVIVFFIVYWNKTFEHHMITTIAMAAYTFFTFTFAIINIVKYKKYNSPVYSAAKNLSLIAGCVSMLTLETTMLTTFGSGESELLKQILLPLTGVAVIGFAITIAIMMIYNGSKQLKQAN